MSIKMIWLKSFGSRILNCVDAGPTDYNAGVLTKSVQVGRTTVYRALGAYAS